MVKKSTLCAILQFLQRLHRRKMLILFCVFITWTRIEFHTIRFWAWLFMCMSGVFCLYVCMWFLAWIALIYNFILTCVARIKIRVVGWQAFNWEFKIASLCNCKNYRHTVIRHLLIVFFITPEGCKTKFVCLTTVVNCLPGGIAGFFVMIQWMCISIHLPA